MQEHAQGSDPYFLESGDKCHFFLEKDAVDPSGQLLSHISKFEAVNKAGHGLHTLEGTVFHEYSTGSDVCTLVRELGYLDPILPQSMYIFKQPRLGDLVTSHQDSTFLWTTPRQTCLGLWLALEDSSEENGCLWARPGSHLEPVRRHFARNPEFFDHGSGPMMVFEEKAECCDISWEGGVPSNLNEAGFVPAPMKAG